MKVALGVTGGIAAYKAAELVRLLQDRSLDVQVVMTRAACEFVTPLTFAALSGHKVITGMFGEAGAAEPNVESAIEHIAVAQSIDALVIAPATADILARIAHGLADDFLTTLVLATKAPILVAPAMNLNMWENAATQANLVLLRGRGVKVVEPDAGYLACGMIGAGRLAAPEAIARAVFETLGLDTHPEIAESGKPVGFGVRGSGFAEEDDEPASALRKSRTPTPEPRPALSGSPTGRQGDDLKGETVLVTAGPTEEPLDPVRYISNRSSGRMGYALAEVSRRRGARVMLVSGPTRLVPPDGVEIERVRTAEEMAEAVGRRVDEASVVLMAAAVADFRPEEVQGTKIKKRDGPPVVKLRPTRDILGEIVGRRRNGQLVVGFAAETDDVLENAAAKAKAKRLDLVVANDVTQAGAGFDVDTNIVTLVFPDGHRKALEMMSKLDVANRVLDEVVELRKR